MFQVQSNAVIWALCASLVFLQCTDAAPSRTKDLPYQFNSVAVTGGGYVTGIIAHDTEPNLMYTRTDIGGAYRWSQKDNKWIPLTDFISEADSNLLGTESIALDTANPNRVYLAQGRYVASGNGAFFVSDDQGRTFEKYPAPFPMGANDLGRNNGERLAVNPFNTDEIWFGTRTAGLAKSLDRAKTWMNVTNFPEPAANGVGIVFVIFDPRNEGHIYVGANVPGGLYYTKDSGRTWSAIPGQPLSWNGTTIYSNAEPQSSGPQPMKANLASNGVFYITYSDGAGPWGITYGGVWKYDTKGSHWSNITPNANNSYPTPFQSQSFPPGGYCGLSVDNKDPNRLVVVSLDRDPGPAIDSMYLSHDGGKSWKDVSQLSTPKESGGFWGHSIEEAKLKNGTGVPWLSFAWSPSWGGYGAPSPVYGLTKFGWWMTAVLIDPANSNHVMYGTGATIWSTDDISNAQVNKAPAWYIQAQGIEETYNLAMISPTAGPHLFSGFGDINGMRHDSLDVPQPCYEQPTFSNLDSLDWAGQNQSIIVRAGVSGLNNTFGCPSGAYSTDAALTWTRFPQCVPGINSTIYSGGKITIDASAKHIVWSSLQTAKAVPEQTGPWTSSDFGANWSAPNGFPMQSGNISSDRFQAATFYSFTAGTWYISTDGGESYTSKTASSIGLPSGSPGAVPVVSTERAGEIWLPLGSLGIYYTRNFGASWTRVGQAGINPSFFTVGAPAPANNNKTPALFLWGKAGTSGPLAVTGLYRSDDNASSWVRVNDEAHQYGGPTVLLADPRVYGRVFIGTGGRGIVYADIVKGGKEGQDNVSGTGGI